MQSRNHFQTWADSAADLGFILRVRGVVAVVGVSDETILEAQRVDGFRQARRERHDAVDRLGNADRAARFVRDFPEDRGRGRDRGSSLRTRHRRAEQQDCDRGESGASKARTGEFFHDSPLSREFVFNNKKAPRDTLGLPASLFLAKSAALCGMGGWPGLRLFIRSQWRDRGRFTRPSPLPFPANSNTRVIREVQGCKWKYVSDQSQLAALSRFLETRQPRNRPIPAPHRRCSRQFADWVWAAR